MKFWLDGQPNSTRLRNAQFTWNRLKEMTKFLKKHEIYSECKVYDFSPIKVIDDSIHIPFEMGEYKKSEKTNIILKNNKDYDFIFMFDSDAFFLEEDYHYILNILLNVKEREITTFDLAHLDEKDVDEVLFTTKVDKNLMNWSYAYSGEKSRGPLCCGNKGSLGGVYLCDINLLLENGGFNENYIGWGGEDGEMMDRIYTSSKGFEHISINYFSPFHLPHFRDISNNKYYKRFKD